MSSDRQEMWDWIGKGRLFPKGHHERKVYAEIIKALRMPLPTEEELRKPEEVEDTEIPF